MKLLYGSQNFGYANDESDHDWLEFVYPTWKDVVNGGIISKEIKNDDGSFTKVKDIRLIPKMIKKANFNDLQFLFSVNKINCNDLNWFFENKDRLIRYDMWQLYKSNSGYINAQMNSNTLKGYIRAYAFTFYLIQVLNKREFVMCQPFFANLRQQINEQDKPGIRSQIINSLKYAESEFEKYKGKVDFKLENEMYLVIESLLRKNII